MAKGYNPEPDGVATSRKLLGQLTVLGAYVTLTARESLVKPPKQGERGLVRAQRKARRKAQAARLRRVSLCSFAEQTAEAERRVS